MAQSPGARKRLAVEMQLDLATTMHASLAAGTGKKAGRHVVLERTQRQLEDAAADLSVGSPKRVDRAQSVIRSAVATLTSMRGRGNALRDADVLLGVLRDHDEATYEHSLRVGELCRSTAQSLGLDDEQVELTYLAGRLHDIGKIAVPSDLLRSAQRLPADGKQRIALHPELGQETLAYYPSIDASIVAAVRHHHEQVGGAGYPDGLTGTQIPLMARIIAACDAFDVITHGRPYAPAQSRRQAIVELQSSPSQFDADVVRALSGSPNVVGATF